MGRVKYVPSHFLLSSILYQCALARLEWPEFPSPGSGFPRGNAIDHGPFKKPWHDAGSWNVGWHRLRTRSMPELWLFAKHLSQYIRYLFIGLGQFRASVAEQSPMVSLPLFLPCKFTASVVSLELQGGDVGAHILNVRVSLGFVVRPHPKRNGSII